MPVFPLAFLFGWKQNAEQGKKSRRCPKLHLCSGYLYAISFGDFLEIYILFWKSKKKHAEIFLDKCVINVTSGSAQCGVTRPTEQKWREVNSKAWGNWRGKRGKERGDREVRKGTRPTMAQHQAATIRTATGSQQTMCWGLHLWRLHLFIYLFIVDEAPFVCKNVDLSLKYETRYHKFSESCFRWKFVWPLMRTVVDPKSIRLTRFWERSFTHSRPLRLKTMTMFPWDAVKVAALFFYFTVSLTFHPTPVLQFETRGIKWRRRQLVAKGHVFNMEIKLDVGNFLPREMERPGANKHTASTDKTPRVRFNKHNKTIGPAFVYLMVPYIFSFFPSSSRCWAQPAPSIHSPSI